MHETSKRRESHDATAAPDVGAAAKEVRGGRARDESDDDEYVYGGDHPDPPPGRRAFLGASVAGLIGLAASRLGGGRPARAELRLRPPGAVAEAEFLDRCTRCFRCSNACPNRCIETHPPGAGLEQMFTPYIDARARGCILCGECAAACPTGALRPFEATRDGWLAGVDMGTARVNEGMCYSFHGRTCGACYRACPLAGQAMTIGLYETPRVHPEACVGCGLCEQACLHLPQAIRVIPRGTRRGASGDARAPRRPA